MKICKAFNKYGSDRYFRVGKLSLDLHKHQYMSMQMELNLPAACIKLDSEHYLHFGTLSSDSSLMKTLSCSLDGFKALSKSLKEELLWQPEKKTR